MKKSNHILFPVLLVLLFASCEKEESLWTLPPKGSEKVETVDLGPNYENVIFYQLSTAVKQQRDLLSWDLAFASGPDEQHIIMNGGKSVQVYNTNDTAFSRTDYSITPANWDWDNPNGHKDSTAIGAWCDKTSQVSNNKVYILDLGQGNPQFKKIKVLSVSAANYTIRVANLDNSAAYTATIVKGSNWNYTYFNVAGNHVVNFEPESKDWDIVFTRYRHLYYDMNPITPYQVNGVLINTSRMSIMETSSMKFEDINAEKASLLMLGKKQDEIGFDWKFYDFDTQKYLVSQKKIYILKDADGYYYKLKFIDFYNEQGAKGFPKFIYQKL